MSLNSYWPGSRAHNHNGCREQCIWIEYSAGAFETVSCAIYVAMDVWPDKEQQDKENEYVTIQVLLHFDTCDSDKSIELGGTPESPLSMVECAGS